MTDDYTVFVPTLDTSRPNSTLDSRVKRSRSPVRSSHDPLLVRTLPLPETRNLPCRKIHSVHPKLLLLIGFGLLTRSLFQSKYTRFVDNRDQTSMNSFIDSGSQVRYQSTSQNVRTGVKTKDPVAFHSGGILTTLKTKTFTPVAVTFRRTSSLLKHDLITGFRFHMT